MNTIKDLSGRGNDLSIGSSPEFIRVSCINCTRTLSFRNYKAECPDCKAIVESKGGRLHWNVSQVKPEKYSPQKISL